MKMNIETAIVIDLIQTHVELKNQIETIIGRCGENREQMEVDIETVFQIKRLEIREQVALHQPTWATTLLMYAMGNINGECNWKQVVDSLIPEIKK